MSSRLRYPQSPLTLDLLLNEYIPPEKQREVLERSQERAQEQLALISDLLEFGRLKELKAAEKAGPVQLDDILRNVLGQLEPQTAEKGWRLQRIFPRIYPQCVSPRIRPRASGPT